MGLCQIGDQMFRDLGRRAIADCMAGRIDQSVRFLNKWQGGALGGPAIVGSKRADQLGLETTSLGVDAPVK